jgi:3-methyladenine DNA glycosylase/8-oxoguanine DNA glycosylase
VEKLAERWAGWRSYATFYLWLTYWEDRAWKASLLESIHVRKKRKSQ